MPGGLRGYRGAGALAVAVFLATFVGLSGESILLQHQGAQMVYAAHSLSEGRGFELTPGMPYARFGPLYPLLLSILERAGMGVIPASYLLNCLTLAASLLGLYALCRALGLERPWPALAFYCLWAANFYLLRAVRPDGIPICMSLFAVVALIRYSQRQSLAALIGAAFACCLAATARYMALFTLVPVAAAAVGVFTTGGWRLRVRHLTGFVAIACTPIGLWLLRNYRVTGYFSGMSRSAPRRWAEDHTFLDNVYLFLRTVALDAFSFLSMGVRRFGDATGHSDALLVIGTAVLACLVVLAVVWSGRGTLRTRLVQQVGERGEIGRGLTLIGTYVACYTLALLVLWSIGNNDPINTRFVAPVYPFAIVIASWLYSAVGEENKLRGPRIALLIVVLAIAAPNAVKSLRLLGDSPGERLIEVRVHETRTETWRDSIDWDRPILRRSRRSESGGTED